jgi:DNA-binding IclR family transcriptional regulator
MSTQYSNNVISKTFAVLKAFTDEKKEWGVHELARYLSIPTSSLHRILKNLREENLLAISHENGKYSVGSEMVRISSIISSQVDIKKVAKPFIESLATTLNESIYLAQYNESHKKLAFIDKAQGSNVLQYVIEIGVLQPITVAASGKAILAFLDERERNEVFRIENIAEENSNKLLEEISEIRKAGFITTANERYQGSLSIGVPIFDASAKVVGSIIYTVPVDRFNRAEEEIIVNLLKQEAGNLSNSLGYKKL